MRAVAVAHGRVVITTALILISSLFVAPPVGAAYNATCDILQAADNTWVARDSETVTTWVTKVTGWISYYNYTLCQDPGIPFIRPEQSSSSAWVAIEGPNPGGPAGGDSIVQVGYIKCQNSTGCAVSGIDSSHWNKVVYFYAFGNSNDLLHNPFPQFIAEADNLPHTFEVYLHYTGGTRQWEFKIDGTIRKVFDDNWRTWNRDHVQVANEIWNEGDQIGGRPPSPGDAGNKQKFRDVVWVNNTVHNGLSGSPYLAGHCYLWANWQTYNAQDWDVWTTNNHTSC